MFDNISKKSRITFDPSLRKEVLKAFNIVTKDSVLIDKFTGEKIVTPQGEYIETKDFGGILNGSRIFLKSDIVALIDYVRTTHAVDDTL